MGQPAAQKKDPATPAQDEIEQYMRVINAKQLFIGTAAGMGWRLAVVVIIPLVAGVKLDDHFHTAPSLTLTGLIIASVASVLVVTKCVKEVNKIQAEAAQSSAHSSRNNHKASQENKK